jgi:DNA topoisomerase I
VNHDLRSSGVSREKVLASIIRLLETSFIRVGNEEYARQNGSFGLTTLKNRHVKVHGANIRFCFRGKSGKQHTVEVTDVRVARVVKRCQELPGQELFECVDESGHAHNINSADVNEYLRKISGEDFTAKDFRTWAGTLLALEFLCKGEKCRTNAQAKRVVLQTVQAVAEKLGNTAAVCRKAYIHPVVLDLAGGAAWPRPLRSKHHGLHANELVLLALLQSSEKNASHR